MMTVTDVFRIKGRGVVFTTILDGDPIPMGQVLVRPSDGQTWTVRGLEFTGSQRRGKPIGVLVGDGPEPAIGDEIERF